MVNMDHYIMMYREESKILFKIFIEEKYELISSVSKSPVYKDSRLSEEARREGNQFFRTGIRNPKVHDHILECYSRSLALAPIDNYDLLAFAYGNRSAFLMHLNKYNECILDIDRAFELITDDVTFLHFKIKLLCRKVKCLKSLGKPFEEVLRLCESCSTNILSDDPDRSKVIELIEATKIFKPTFREEDERIEKKFDDKCEKQLENVSVAYDQKYGRHIVANRDFKPGEVIYLEDFYAAVPSKEKTYKYCAHCLGISWAGIPCHCCDVIYCSAKCREESWSQSHQVECAILPALKLAVDGQEHEIMYVALRILIKGIQEMGSIAKLKNELKKLDDSSDYSPGHFLKVDQKIKQSFKNIYLLHDKKNFERELIWLYGRRAMLILLCLIKYSSFFGKSHSLENIDLLMIEEDIFFIGILLVRLCIINGVYIHANDCIRGFSGLFQPILSSLMNHSCFPNAAKIFATNNKIVACALQPIKKGSQIFESYGFDNNICFNTPKQDRQTNLSKDDSRFRCDCRPCLENWPTPKELALVQGMSSAKMFYEISQECRDIILATGLGKRDFTHADVEILSNNLCICMEKFELPHVLTFSLYETLFKVLLIFIIDN